MTKGVFKESVYIKLNGGHLNSESSVDRRDIDAYLPAAVNYVMAAAYNVNLKIEGNRDYSSLFYGYFPAQQVLTDASRHNWLYINTPKAYVPLPRNQGIRGIEDGCGYQLKPLSDNAFRTIGHFSKIFTGDKYYRPEGTKIYLFNIPPITASISVSLIVDSDALDDTDELPIMAGFEYLAIDKCFEYISGERQEPADRKSDQRDIN